ncbi:MAG: arsenate reductase ArsC [Dehalococcoidales bacterium]|jgi:arsenate reductase|nr:arsenate reductase ArsC [Dehalococcoidales bacterium]
MKKVLFICVHNAGRSQMAEAFFNHMSGGKALAISAGSRPAEQVNPAAVEVMREVGIDISHNKPKLLTPEMLEGVDRVITMGCGEDIACPATWVETEDWDLEDPAGKPPDKVREIRDEIKRRVTQLIANLKD